VKVSKCVKEGNTSNENENQHRYSVRNILIQFPYSKFSRKIHMADTSATLDNELQKFHSICVRLDHQIHFTSWMKDAGKRTIEKYSEYIEARGGNKDDIGTGTALAVINVFSTNDFPVRSPIGAELSRGERVNQLTEEINLRLNGILLCSLHEAWENYVKKALSIMLFAFKNNLIMRDLPKFKNFHDKKRKKYHKTFLYFEEYANFICRQNCNDAYELFKKQLEFPCVIKQKYHLFDVAWFEICKALALLRNSIIHADGRINIERLKRLDSQIVNIIKTNMIHKSEITNDDRLLVPDAFAGYFVEAMATHAYTIYVLLTKKASLPRKFDYFIYQKLK
jgi:hypothetical protein